MSAIYFHAKDGRMRISGCERAHFGNLCHQMLCASVGSLMELGDERHWLRKLLPPDHYLHRSSPDRRPFEWDAPTALQADGRFRLHLPTGEQLDPWTIGLNTALAMGGDVLRLVARIHGQCELHGFVEGRHRAWLAGLIEHGLRDRIFRQGMGWEALIPWLRSSSDESVVTSYSVCDSFPPVDVRTDERMTWDAAMYQLRTGGGGLEFMPEHWAWPDFHFGEYRVTGFHLEDLATGALKLEELRETPT